MVSWSRESARMHTRQMHTYTRHGSVRHPPQRSAIAAEPQSTGKPVHRRRDWRLGRIDNNKGQERARSIDRTGE
jgi:hypothetical protein